MVSTQLGQCHKIFDPFILGQKNSTRAPYIYKLREQGWQSLKSSYLTAELGPMVDVLRQLLHNGRDGGGDDGRRSSY